PNLSPFSKKIAGSNIGIIGYGAIGKKIAQYLKGFSCRLTCYNREGIGNDPEYTFRKLSDYPEVIGTHDFVFLSIALTNATKHLVDKHFLNALDKHAVLINVSRGEIIEEDHLYDHLKKCKTF